ncbi:Translation initiation factor IF-3 [Camponotus floridanus]|uniref:Translation initiation factor IF-3 n=1 Tax=Camponotus floridanus TaxID=104421 RepID=E2AYT3_CAMFO|nr:uncharacterized protein LOC105257477 [Camponotus floridanus]EFN61446.1 Translation initiation factor IF-3 [Camponotus floridanus]
MAAPRLLTALRRAIYRVQDFNKCCLIGDVRAFNKKSILEENDDVASAKQQRPKTVPVPKITLVSLDNSMTVTVLEDAQRLAKRRKLNLIKVNDFDSKTQRPVYKLMSSSVFIEEIGEKVEEDHGDKQKSKGAKLHYISAKIAEHDLLTKTRNVVKLLNKGHKIKIVITLDSSSENNIRTRSVIEDALKNYGSIQQMPSKKNVLLLIINPILNKNKDNSVVNKEGTDTT